MELQKIRNANTRYLGKNILFFEEIDSTQEEAKRRLQNGEEPNGTLIITDFQTNGKGTKSRKWYASKENNIMMTIMLQTNWKMEKIEGLTVTIAQAIATAIKELYGYELKIKEPNDLFLNGKKICGILTQATTREEKVTHLIIGIGFNVNEEYFSDEVKEIATSLKKEYKKTFNREEIIVNIMEKMEKILL